MEVAERKTILSPGDMIRGYRVEGLLGRGGFGVTYAALDTSLQLMVAIKEYMPENIVSRGPDNTIVPKTDSENELFNWGLSRFIKEAQTLAKFKHPHIVRVMAVFEYKGTAYMVMEYEGGQDFKQVFSLPQNRTEAYLKKITSPVIDGLMEVHRLGYIHRDIKPANILVRESDEPVLLDFGSARLSSSTALTALVSFGYAPLEQYHASETTPQGPWTDIYALAAVLYFTITGRPPVDATVRCTGILNDKRDPLVSLASLQPHGFSERFCTAIDWALSFRIGDRPQSLDEWRQHLFAEEETPALTKGRPKAKKKPKGKVSKTVPVSAGNKAKTRRHTQALSNGKSSGKRVKKHGYFQRRTGVLITVLLLVVCGGGFWKLQESRRQESMASAQRQRIEQQIAAGVEARRRADEEAQQARLLRQQEEERQAQETEAEQQRVQEAEKAANAKAERLRQEKARRDAERRRQQKAEETALREEAEKQAALSESSKSREKETNIDTAPSITDEDMYEVLKQFNVLTRAIQEKDLDEVKRVTDYSQRKYDYLEYLFSNFESIQVRMRGIRSSRLEQTIWGTLQIEYMIRSNSNRAFPPAEFQNIVVSSTREKTWSKIHW